MTSAWSRSPPPPPAASFAGPAPQAAGSLSSGSVHPRNRWSAATTTAAITRQRRIGKAPRPRGASGLRRELEHLLDETVDAGVTRFVWLRQFEPGSNSAAANRLLDRLEHLRHLDFPEGLFDDVPAHRITRLRWHGERYFADGLRELPENRRDSRRLRRRVGDVSRRCRGGEPRPDHFKPSKTVPLLLAFPFPSRHHHRAGSTSTTSAEVTSRPTTNAASSAGPMYPAAAGRVRFVGHERTAPRRCHGPRFARSRPGARSRTTKSLRSRGRPGARGLRLPTNPNGRTNADVLKPWINGNGPDPATGGEVDRRLRVDDVRRRRGAVRRAAQRSSGEPPAAR